MASVAIATLVFSKLPSCLYEGGSLSFSHTGADGFAVVVSRQGDATSTTDIGATVNGTFEVECIDSMQTTAGASFFGCSDFGNVHVPDGVLATLKVTSNLSVNCAGSYILSNRTLTMYGDTGGATATSQDVDAAYHFILSMNHQSRL